MSRARDLADGTFSGAFSADSPTLVVDAANNRVGIGTASPSATLHVANTSGNGELIVEGGSPYTGYLYIQANRTAGSGSTVGSLQFRNTGNSDEVVSQISTSASRNMAFHTNGSERMRIDSSGNVLVNKTSLDGAEKLSVNFDRTSQQGMSINNTSSTAPSNATMIEFRYAGTTNGSIGSNGSSTSYNTSSDYRLKENIAELSGAIDRIKQVPVHRFNFITDPNKTVDGFLAHEVADVVPEAIHGTKDEVDAEGNPVYQGIDQSKLVPLLTAAIKEQQALIEDLQTRIAALEAV